MARDSVIKPRLHDVAQYSGYFRFRIAHRAFWEQSAHFEHHYQERIFALADREAKTHAAGGQDSMLNWDLWYHTIVHPIKTVAWQTWEQSINLESRYLEALVNSGLASPTDVQRLIDHTGSEPEEEHDISVEAVNYNVSQGVVSQLLGWWRGAAV